VKAKLHPTFSNKEISLRLRRPHNGQTSLYGFCVKILASGLLLRSEPPDEKILFIPTETIDLVWVDEKGS